MKTEVNVQEIENNLSMFNGSETVYQTSRLKPNLVHTEGVKYLADNCQCYWLLDIIMSISGMQRFEPFIACTLKRNKTGNGAKFEATDGNGRRLYVQVIPYTDIPLKEVTLWLSNDCIYLPSEH